MSDYNLTFTQLKEKAGIKNNELSNNTIHRWIQFGLISSKRHYHSGFGFSIYGCQGSHGGR